MLGIHQNSKKPKLAHMRTKLTEKKEVQRNKWAHKYPGERASEQQIHEINEYRTKTGITRAIQSKTIMNWVHLFICLSFSAMLLLLFFYCRFILWTRSMRAVFRIFFLWQLLLLMSSLSSFILIFSFAVQCASISSSFSFLFSYSLTIIK